MSDERYLSETALLDYRHPAIARLLATKRWGELPAFERIGAIYDYVRDGVAFGYNDDDAIAASRVLEDGYGQCNTKSTLFMALLRGAGVPCRFHGFTIDKRLQKGLINGVFYALAPRDIVHSWVEVEVDGRWVALEGVILDGTFLHGLRASLPRGTKAYLGHGVGTDNLAEPAVAWRGHDTFIQRTGIRKDFGLFDDPDTFYARHGGNLTGPKAWLFRRLVRHVMNANVDKLRGCATGRQARPLLDGDVEKTTGGPPHACVDRVP